MQLQKLEAARSELLKRLPVRWAHAASSMGSAPQPQPPHVCATSAAAAPPLLPDLAADALALIGAARKLLGVDRRHRRGSSSSSSSDGDGDGDKEVRDKEQQQQGSGTASSVKSSPADGAKTSGAIYGALKRYMRGTADQRRQLLARELFMPALSSLQPAVAVRGSHSGGASAGKASGGGVSAGGGSGGFCPSPAVSELEVDRLSLRASSSWADLTLVETKTSSKGGYRLAAAAAESYPWRSSV